MKDHDTGISSDFFPLHREVELLGISQIAESQTYNADLNLRLCFVSPERKSPKAINTLLALLYLS